MAALALRATSGRQVVADVVARGAVGLAVPLALVLLALSIASYPGGNDLDPRAPGFDPARNYLSDLLHDPALDGSPNPAAPLARAALLAMIAALPPFFLVLSRRAASPALGRFVLGAGLLSTLGWLAVPFTPSDRFGGWHGMTILVAVAPGLAATSAGALALRATSPRLAVLGAATLACVALSVALYVPLLAGATCVSLAVPALQKVAGALLVAWMLLVALAPWPPGRSETCDGRSRRDL